MRFVVTGASSFLGSAMIHKLRENGHDVTAFRHSFEDAEEKLPSGCDAWVHFAWAGAGSKGRDDADIQSFNVRMSMAALEKAIELGSGSFVFAGSQAEYGRAQDGNLKKEDGDALPVSRYGVAKLLFSKLAKTRVSEYNAGRKCPLAMRFVHARIFSVYGPGDHEGSLINTLIRSVKSGERLKLSSCGQQWNYLYIDDAADALYTLCLTSADGIYNIGGLDTRPLREYIYEAASLLSGGDDPDKYLIFGAREDNAEGSADLSPDITRLMELGFKPRVSFSEGIKMTAGTLA